MYQNLRVAAVIPCYRVRDFVIQVIEGIPDFVDEIIIVDDCCPQKTGEHVRTLDIKRVTVVCNPINLGVGGAVKAGYAEAVRRGCDIAVKVDGDGQMDPKIMTRFLAPIAAGSCDYTKGNRFFNVGDVLGMPALRLLGNAILSFASKASTGYWNIFDPTNGYTALHLRVLPLLSLEKVADRYFFESDLLFRLGLARCVVRDVPMTAVYGDEPSSLKIGRIVLPFLTGHIRNFSKRVFYNYFLRDFQVASLCLLIGAPALIGGSAFALYHWWLSVAAGQLASAGTVMVGALAILSGLQLILAAISYDISNVPRDALHPSLS